MGRILQGLKLLGSKMTGAEIRSNRIGDALNEIGQKYSGGGSGGGMTIIEGGMSLSTGNIEFENYDEVWQTVVSKFPQVMVNARVNFSGTENDTILFPMGKQATSGGTVGYMFQATNVANGGEYVSTMMLVCTASEPYTVTNNYPQ